MPDDRWSAAAAYEPFMGRWSRRLASTALSWLAPPPGQRWVDVGCGTGAVSEAVLADVDPASVVGVDPSEAYVAAARTRLADGRGRFELGDAARLPLPDASSDHVVSGLVLNFVSGVDEAVTEMRRVLVSGGRVSAWVWDYADGMQMLRSFWDAVLAEDPLSAHLDEGVRFALCQERAVAETFERCGLVDVRGGAIEIPLNFVDFHDYWAPFLGGQGPAPTYLTSLSGDRQRRLRDRVRDALPTQPDGSIRLTGRAWIASGVSPG